MASHNEAQKTKADWLRSEIEKLEGMRQAFTGEDEVLYDPFHVEGWNQALTSIITRYKEELLELEKGV